MVRATGRRVHTRSRGWFWYGLKVHATEVALGAELELHFVPQGYVGLCRLSGAVNVCGLFRSRGPVPDLKQKWQTLLRGPPGTVLHTRLQNAVLQEGTFCAVAGIRTGLAKPPPAECVLGDAWSMIAPFTGNGMSMAFEAAELAIDPLKAYSSGTIDWTHARAQIGRRCRRRFQARLLWSDCLDRILLSRSVRPLLSLFCARFPLIARSLFQRTR